MCLRDAIKAGLRRKNGQEEARLMMVGPAAAGKTTILYKLKLGDVVPTIPTVGFSVETVECKSFRFTVWELRDIAGQDKLRKLWRHSYTGMGGVIFVVDSTDHASMEEARKELHSILREDELAEAAVLVLANKQDLPDAMSPEDVGAKLCLDNLPGFNRWFVQPACATSGDGLHEGLEWLSQEIRAGK